MKRFIEIVKYFVQFILSIFSDSKGVGSSKRLIAHYLAFAYIWYIFSVPVPDQNVVYGTLGSITLLLGVSAVTKT